MTVAELIAELEKMPSDAEVITWHEGMWARVEGVDEPTKDYPNTVSIYDSDGAS